MNVAVPERTREIQLKMSLGARSMDLWGQFFIEAIIISSRLRLKGLVLVTSASKLVFYFVHWSILITQSSEVICFFSLFCNGFFLDITWC